LLPLTSLLALCSLALSFSFSRHGPHRALHSFPTRRSSDLSRPHKEVDPTAKMVPPYLLSFNSRPHKEVDRTTRQKHFDLESFNRSEEHTSELQSRFDLVCRLLLEKKNTNINTCIHIMSR